MDAHADTHSRTSKEQFNFLLIRKALEESDLKGNYSQTETSSSVKVKRFAPSNYTLVVHFYLSMYIF